MICRRRCSAGLAQVGVTSDEYVGRSTPALDFAQLETIKVRFEESVCHLQFHRPEANNAISAQLVAECTQVLAACEQSVSVVVLSGLPEVFCFGADFREVECWLRAGICCAYEGPGPMYDLWLKLATGPFVVISYVRGKANAGGLGFIGASDIVLADESAQFSLSELLFGLYPACVLPFLMRRIGFQKAHYLTLSTQAITASNCAGLGAGRCLRSAGRATAAPACDASAASLAHGAGALQDLCGETPAVTRGGPRRGCGWQSGSVHGRTEPARDLALCAGRAVSLGAMSRAVRRSVPARCVGKRQTALE